VLPNFRLHQTLFNLTDNFALVSASLSLSSSNYLLCKITLDVHYYVHLLSTNRVAGLDQLDYIKFFRCTGNWLMSMYKKLLSFNMFCRLICIIQWMMGWACENSCWYLSTQPHLLHYHIQKSKYWDISKQNSVQLYHLSHWLKCLIS